MKKEKKTDLFSQTLFPRHDLTAKVSNHQQLMLGCHQKQEESVHYMLPKYEINQIHF